MKKMEKMKKDEDFEKFLKENFLNRLNNEKNKQEYEETILQKTLIKLSLKIKRKKEFFCTYIKIVDKQNIQSLENWIQIYEKSILKKNKRQFDTRNKELKKKKTEPEMQIQLLEIFSELAFNREIIDKNSITSYLINRLNTEIEDLYDKFKSPKQQISEFCSNFETEGSNTELQNIQQQEAEEMSQNGVAIEDANLEHSEYYSNNNDSPPQCSLIDSGIMVNTGIKKQQIQENSNNEVAIEDANLKHSEYSNNNDSLPYQCSWIHQGMTTGYSSNEDYDQIKFDNFNLNENYILEEQKQENTDLQNQVFHNNQCNLPSLIRNKNSSTLIYSCNQFPSTNYEEYQEQQMITEESSISSNLEHFNFIEILGIQNIKKADNSDSKEQEYDHCFCESGKPELVESQIRLTRDQIVERVETNILNEIITDFKKVIEEKKWKVVWDNCFITTILDSQFDQIPQHERSDAFSKALFFPQEKQLLDQQVDDTKQLRKGDLGLNLFFSKEQENIYEKFIFEEFIIKNILFEEFRLEYNWL